MKLRWKIAQAAEIRWWQSYLKGKPEDDYHQWKNNYWQNLLSKINVNPDNQERILDAGCGPAGIFMTFKNQPVDAVDPLLDQYEEKLAHFSKNRYPNVRFFAEPLEKFEAEQPYDTVFCLNAINHVSDLHLCFDKLIAMTKVGGRLVVSIDAHNWSFFRHLFRAVPGDILHPHQYNLEEYERFLTDRNCALEKPILMDEAFFFDYYVLVGKRLK
ncbi:MAG: trans-aconitate 2-methyltransferase [Saprospiraceae bacterium]